MSGRATNPERKPRADAVCNRERLLKAKAAADIFCAGGPDASFEAVAKRGGVGIGTLDARRDVALRLRWPIIPGTAERSPRAKTLRRADAGSDSRGGSRQRAGTNPRALG